MKTFSIEIVDGYGVTRHENAHGTRVYVEPSGELLVICLDDDGEEEIVDVIYAHKVWRKVACED